MLRLVDGQCISKLQTEADPNNPGSAAEQLIDMALDALRKNAGINRVQAPEWYTPPHGDETSDYMLRLEQQLAVVCMNLNLLKGGGLSGERDIVEGILRLCLRCPNNLTTRMVFTQTLRQMKKVKPEVIGEYQEKIRLLQQEHPLSGEHGRRINAAISDILSSVE